MLRPSRTDDLRVRSASRLALVHALLLAVYVPWYLATRSTEMPWVWANDVFYELLCVPPLVAAWLVAGSDAVCPASRRAWRLLLVAHVVGSVPALVRTITDFQGRDLPFGTDLIWLAYYPLNIVALLLMPSAPQDAAARRTLAVDALIVAVAGVAVSVTAAIEPAVHAMGTPRLLPITTYALADLLLFMALCVLLARRAHPGDQRAIFWLAASFALGVVGDLIWSYGRVQGSSDVGTLTDPIWLGAEVAFTAAAAFQLRDAGRGLAAEPRPVGVLRAAIFPHLAILTLLGGLAWTIVDGRPSLWLLAGLAASVALLQARQLLALRENAALIEAQRAQEARFRAVVQHAADLVMVVRPDGMVRYLSPSALRVLGVDEGTPASLTIAGFVHPDDRGPLAELLAATAARPTGGGVGATLRCRDRQGAWRRLECVLTNLLGEPAVGGIVINGRDVSEREALERQLAHAQKTEAIGRLAGGIAHDFNNLLAVVSANAELLEDEPLEGEAREALHEVARAARRGADLTRRLLAFSRRQQITHADVVPLDTVVREAEPMLRRLVAKDVAITVLVGAGSAGVRVDPTQLEQVLINLAVNARDAMPDGGTLSVTTRAVTLDGQAARRIAGAMPGEYVELVVRDNGAGMDEATRARLFEPFFTTKPTGEGTGLGLYIVYGIVAQAGGHIVVDSTPGQGTTFRILLPRHDVAAAPAAALPAAAPRGSERILVVDDEEAIRSALQRYLQRQGYAVSTAADGGAALALLEEGGPFDLVLTDVVMPGLDGRVLVERVRQRWPGLRIMCMSGYTEDTAVRELVPPELFVSKPFALDAMGHRVRSALDAGLGDGEVVPAA